MLWKEFYSEPIFLGNKFIATSFTWCLEKGWSYHICWKERQPGFESSSWESENSDPKRHLRADSRACANAGFWPLGVLCLSALTAPSAPNKLSCSSLSTTSNSALISQFLLDKSMNRFTEIKFKQRTGVTLKKRPRESHSGGDWENRGWGHPTAAADSPPGSSRARTSWEDRPTWPTLPAHCVREGF